MLAGENRLRSSTDFGRTISGGSRAGGPLLVAHLLLDSGEPHRPEPRVGFVVSKAVGSAVVRNRVKRRLRHLVRDRLVALPEGSMLAIRALPSAATVSTAELGAELDRLLTRLQERRQ